MPNYDVRKSITKIRLHSENALVERTQNLVNYIQINHCPKNYASIAKPNNIEIAETTNN